MELPRFGDYTRTSSDSFPGQFAQYAVPLHGVVMVALTFSTPNLDCHDILQVGSRSTFQHGLEIGTRRSTHAGTNGRYFLTTGINGIVDNKPLYAEYPPTDSGYGIEITKDVVYSVLIVLDLYHSRIEYYDMHPSSTIPVLLYHATIIPELKSEWIRPLAVSYRLEFTMKSPWEVRFQFPGIIHQFHQWQMDFPGQVPTWRDLHATLQFEQFQCLSIPGYDSFTKQQIITQTPEAISKHCMARLVKVTVQVVFTVQAEELVISMVGMDGQPSPPKMSSTFTSDATERQLLYMQQSLFRDQVSLWYYDQVMYEDRLPGVDLSASSPAAARPSPGGQFSCSASTFQPLVGGIIPDGVARVSAIATFWKRVKDTTYVPETEMSA